MAFNALGVTADAADVQQILDALTGVSGAGQQMLFNQFNSSSLYALTVRNLDTSNGYALKVTDASDNILIQASKNALQLGASAANDSLAINANISGILFMGDSANAKMTVGLTINQGAALNDILAFKQVTVAHGMTDDAETDTYAHFRTASTAEGGLLLVGLTEATVACVLNGKGVTDDVTKSTAGVAYISVKAQKKTGTTTGAAGANANLFAILNDTTTRFIFDTEGSGHADVEWTTYDQHDDLALIADTEAELLASEDAAKTERRHYLEAAGIIGKDSWHYEDGKPRAMVNMTKLAMLHHGALLQVSAMLRDTQQRLDVAESRLATLSSGV